MLAGELADDPHGTVHLRLAVCNLHTVVLEQMDSAAFHNSVLITTDLFEEFQKVLTYKEYAKVVTGLKTLVRS